MLNIFLNSQGEDLQNKIWARFSTASAQKKVLDLQDLWWTIWPSVSPQRSAGCWAPLNNSVSVVPSPTFLNIFLSHVCYPTAVHCLSFKELSLFWWRSQRISSPYSIKSFPKTGQFLDLFPDYVISPNKFPNSFTPEIWQSCNSGFTILHSSASFLCYRRICII